MKDKPKQKQNHFSITLGKEDMKRLRKVQAAMLQESAEDCPRVTRGTAVAYAVRKCAEAIGE